MRASDLLFPLVFVATAITGCSGGEPTAAPPAPARVFSISVSGSSGITLRHGDSLQLSAVAKDSAGNVLPNVRFTWSGGREGVLEVDSAGLVRANRGSGFGNGFFVVKAAAGGVEGQTTVWIGDWSFSKSYDSVTLDSTTYLIKSSATGGLSLTLRCTQKSKKFEVFVTTGQITQNGAVVWRLSNGTPKSETWNESTDFKSLFYGGSSARGFVSQLAAADTLFFQYNVFQSGSRSGYFLLRYMSDYTPKVQQSCP